MAQTSYPEASALVQFTCDCEERNLGTCLTTTGSVVCSIYSTLTIELIRFYNGAGLFTHLLQDKGGKGRCVCVSAVPAGVWNVVRSID